MRLGLTFVLSLVPLLLHAQAGGPPRNRAKDGPPKPAPRWTDGHVDLGNHKGVWNPRVVQNLASDGKLNPLRYPDGPKPNISFQPWA